MPTRDEPLPEVPPVEREDKRPTPEFISIDELSRFDAQEARAIVEYEHLKETNPNPTLYERFWCWRQLGHIKAAARRQAFHVYVDIHPWVRGDIAAYYFHERGFTFDRNTFHPVYRIGW